MFVNLEKLHTFDFTEHIIDNELQFGDAQTLQNGLVELGHVLLEISRQVVDQVVDRWAILLAFLFHFNSQFTYFFHLQLNKVILIINIRE